MTDETDPNAKKSQKGTFVFQQFGIIAAVIAALLVSLVFSAFPGLKLYISKTFDHLAASMNAAQSTHK